KTRKAENIARNPNCVITIATHDFDLVFEGPATKIVDPARLGQIAEMYTKEGWSPTVVKDGLTAKYSAPSAGPPPWHVYEVKPETVFALGTSEPYGATRWNFQTSTRRKYVKRPYTSTMKPFPLSKENSTSPVNSILFQTFLFLVKLTTLHFNYSIMSSHSVVSITCLAMS